MKKRKHKQRKKKVQKVPSSLKTQIIPAVEKPAGEKPQGESLLRKIPDRFATERLNRAISKIMAKQDFESYKEAERFIQEKIIGKNLDEIYEFIDLDSSDEAQELAYQAMEEEDFYKALELANRALELDPDCIDALMIKTKISSRSLPEMVERVKKVISRAEDRLGKRYFEENKGHFWVRLKPDPI